MRQLIHNLLSGLPPLVISIVALVLTAYPNTVIRWYATFSLALKEPWVLSASVASVVVYSLVWIYTGIKGKDRREKIRDGLLPFYELSAKQLNTLRMQETDEKYKEYLAVVNEHQLKIASWLTDNVSQTAVEKYTLMGSLASSWTWPGEHDGLLRQNRSHVLTTLKDRLNNLQEIMQQGNWDGRIPSRWSKIKRSIRSRLAT